MSRKLQLPAHFLCPDKFSLPVNIRGELSKRGYINYHHKLRPCSAQLPILQIGNRKLPTPAIVWNPHITKQEPPFSRKLLPKLFLLFHSFIFSK